MMKVNFLEPTRIESIGTRYHNHPGPYAIQMVDLNGIFPGIQDVVVKPEISEHVKGDADPPNLEVLCRIARHQKPKTILEFGTFRGKTAYNMALHTPRYAKVITVDLPLEMLTGKEQFHGTDEVYIQEKSKIGTFYIGTEQEKKIVQVFSDCTSQEFQKELDEILAGDAIDLAFIDASHDYETTKHNFEKVVLPRLSRNGIVAFDDYSVLPTHPGVTHYLTRKAHDEGFVFYWYAPINNRTSLALFMNLPQSKNREWRKQQS